MSGRAPLDRGSRRGRVLDIVVRSEYVGVDELSRELEVSRGTIKADLRDLEAEGRLRRVWGGAQPAEGAGPRAVPPTGAGQVSLMVAALVRQRDTVLLACADASAAVAAAMVGRTDLTELTVVTGDVAACEMFADHLDRFTVRVTGGTLARGSLVASRVADHARPSVDIAVLPCHRVDSAGQVHLTADQLAAASALAAVNARKIVLLSVGDVFAGSGGEPWLAIGDVDALITGAAGDKSTLDRLRADGAQILVAT